MVLFQFAAFSNETSRRNARQIAVDGLYSNRIMAFISIILCNLLMLVSNCLKVVPTFRRTYTICVVSFVIKTRTRYETLRFWFAFRD